MVNSPSECTLLLRCFHLLHHPHQRDLYTKRQVRVHFERHVYANNDEIEAHGCGMRFKSTTVSIHEAEIQLVRGFDHRGFCQLQKSFVNDEDHTFVTDKDLCG